MKSEGEVRVSLPSKIGVQKEGEYGGETRRRIIAREASLQRIEDVTKDLFRS